MLLGMNVFESENIKVESFFSIFKQLLDCQSL